MKTKDKTNKKPKAKKKKTPQERAGVKLYIFSALKGLIFWILAFMLSVFISYKAGLGRDKYYVIAIVVNALAALVSGFIFAGKKKKRGVPNGILGGLPVIAAAVISALVAGGGAFSSRTVILILAMIFSSIIGGFTAVNLRR